MQKQKKTLAPVRGDTEDRRPLENENKENEDPLENEDLENPGL